MASLSGNVTHVDLASPGFTIVCPIFRCWSFALFCLWFFEFLSWFPSGFVTVSPLPPSHSPVPYHQRYPRPLLAAHLTCHLTSHSFLSPTLHGTVSFLTSQASLPPTHAHIFYFFSHSYCTSRSPRCIRRTILFNNTALSFCRCPTRLHAIHFARLR